jgi:hypothetical protein
VVEVDQAWIVQGRSQNQRDLLDVESVAGHLLAAGSVFAFLALLTYPWVVSVAGN